MIQPCIARALECIPLSWKRTQARSFLRLGGSWLAGRRQAGLDAFHAAASMTEIGEGHIREAVERADIVGRVDDRDRAGVRFDARAAHRDLVPFEAAEIGRASCRERVCQYV